MEPFISEDSGVWLKAQFVSSETLQATPRCVMIHQRDDTGKDLFQWDLNRSIAICKEACLQSIPGHHKGTIFKKCTHRTILLAEACPASSDVLDESQMASSMGGLMASQVTPPLLSEFNYLLFACESFLDSYGFYNNEPVWFAIAATPLPLDKVVLECTSPDDTEEVVTDVVTQIYDQCQSSTIIAKTGFKLLHRLKEDVTHPPKEELHLLDNDEDMNWMDTDSIDSSITPPTSFRVVETLPTLQGRITRDTSIIIIPYISPAPVIEGDISAVSSSATIDDNIFSSISTASIVTQPSSRTRTVSASDIFEESGHVVDMTPFVNDTISLPSSIRTLTVPPTNVAPPTPDASFTIEARIGEEFSLLYHDVVIPKTLARKHNIWDLQSILISPVTTETHTRSEGGGGRADNTIVTLFNELKEPREGVVLSGCGPVVRKRLAIARVYESKVQLQSLVPRTSLKESYTDDDLDSAYLHPELVFNLFCETLSVTPKQFFISIENMTATPSPSPLLEYSRENPLSASNSGKPIGSVGKKTDIKKMVLGSVNVPVTTFSEEFIKESIKKHLIESQKKIIVSKNDAFSVNTELGKLLLRVLQTIPDTEYGGITGDDVVYSRSYASYLPHLFCPAHPLSYWEVPHPPGLESYCDTLFQYFLPCLMPKNESFSCANVIISGPPGVGKSTIIKSVAKRCRLNVKEFNCYDFFSEGLKVAEQKLIHAFDKAIDYTPCVMVLKEIQVLSRQDLSVSSGSHEPRIDAAFEHHIADISNQLISANYPFIVVGVTSSPQEVSPRIQHCFLHELPVKPPEQEQRVSLIQGLTLQYPITRDIDQVDLARRSAGFVLGDYQELFSKAHKLAVSDISSKMKRHLNVDDSWINEHHLSIFGAVIDQSHLDSALNQLHTLHSGYIGAPKIPNVKWKDVGGLEEAKKEILETIQLPLLHPELFVGDLRRSGVLLYGAPGTGKTLLAKAVATECSLNFLSVKGPELINMYVGQTEENIREIFARARGAAPCVVFFDELDSLAPNRGKSGDSGGVMDRVVSQLLAELDGLDQKKDVFVIGATNRPDLIDPALLRPGRFDRLVYLDVCDDTDSKLTILKAITRKFKLDEDVDLVSVAKTCPAHLTGADLYALCADSMLASLRRQIHHLESNALSDTEWAGSLIVSQKDFITSLDNLTPSVSKAELEMYRKKQFLQNVN